MTAICVKHLMPYMLTRYSSSIFSLRSLTSLSPSVILQTIRHIWGSRVSNWGRKHLVRENLKRSYWNDRLIDYQENTKYVSDVSNHIGRILNTITTKNFSKIFCTVNNGIWLTVGKRIVRIWKLRFCRSQLVDLHTQQIFLRPKLTGLT